MKCCNSKCPNCWTKEDTKNLFIKLVKSNKKLYQINKIDYETYLHNLEMINKYER